VALAATGAMTAMSNNNDGDDDGYDNNGRQRWRKLPAPVPIDGAR
jgi:hypothetical protein